MSGPLEAAGVTKNPTRYAALSMGSRQFTGLWTQRSPYRDAAVPYLTAKYYSGSRFDSIIDGINREISSKLTDQRRAGNPIYNSLTFPPAKSFFSWKYIQDTQEIVRVIMDGKDGVIYDATAGQKSTLYTKAAGAGPARFLGVNTELFFGDGVEQKKILRSSKIWKASTDFTVGDFIIDSNGNLQSFQSKVAVLTISSATIVTKTPVAGAPQNFLVVTFSAPVPVIPDNQPATFSGSTLTRIYRNIAAGWGLNLNPDQLAFPVAGTPGESGTMTTYLQKDALGNALIGTTGASAPAWQTAHGALTQDGSVTWMCFGSPVGDWQVPAPASAPLLGLGYSEQTWPTVIDPSINPSQGMAIIDSNGSYQVATNFVGPSPIISGINEPVWNTALGGITKDGSPNTILWMNVGKPLSWYPLFQYSAPIVAIIDNNGNLQVTTDYFITQTIWTAGTANTSGATDLTGSTEPTWNTALLGTTTDGSYTWTNYGSAAQLSAGTLQYAYSYHQIDGSISTASPVSFVLNPVVGQPGLFTVGVLVLPSTNPLTDKIYIWRTAGGQPTLVFLDQIPNIQVKVPFADLSYSYIDILPDTSTTGGQALNPFIPAPVADSADPPPLGMTAPVYHLQRVWGIVDNAVVWSGGPDTITGNGNTAFPPLNRIPFLARPIRLFPVTVENGGIIVFTTDGVYIILGLGTSTNRFYATKYYPSVSVSGYDALDFYNNAIFVMESNRRVSTIAVEYPFNPQTGYIEVGFPIGDQFVKVTTGGISSSLYDSETAYLSWAIVSTKDISMFVADGAVGWFRMQMVSPPESGLIWDTRAEIEGGTSAVQSVQIAPKTRALLIGPPTSGPILMRDATDEVWQDNGVPYPAWDIKGVNQLCTTGEWVEVAHISTKSMPLGARPKVSVLMNEISASAQRPWDVLNLASKSNDPAETPKSISVYSDRYELAQNGKTMTGDCISTKFDFGTQAFGDELLDWGIYATVHDERQEEAAK